MKAVVLADKNNRVAIACIRAIALYDEAVVAEIIID
jgi:hypothetical protein